MNRSRESQNNGKSGEGKLTSDGLTAAPDAVSFENFSLTNLPSTDRFSGFGSRMSPVRLGELSSPRQYHDESLPSASLDEVIKEHFTPSTGVGLGSLLSVEKPKVRKLNDHEVLAVAFRGASGSFADFMWASSLFDRNLTPVRHVLEVLNLTSGLEETRELAVQSLLRLKHPHLIELFTASVVNEPSAAIIERTLSAAFALSDEAVAQVWQSAKSNPAAHDIQDPIERQKKYSAPIVANASGHSEAQSDATKGKNAKIERYWQSPELSLLALQLNLANTRDVFEEKAGEIQEKFPKFSVATFAAVANSQGLFQREWMLAFFALNDELSDFCPLLAMLPRTEYVDTAADFFL